MCPGALTVTAQTNVKKPGRAAWVYWAYNHGTKDFKMPMGGFLLVIPTK
jgi:hypothetical protein